MKMNMVKTVDGVKKVKTDDCDADGESDERSTDRMMND